MLQIIFYLIIINKILIINYQIILVLNETFINFYKNLTLIFDLYSMGFFIIIATVVINVLRFMNIYINKNINIKTFFFITKIFIFSIFLLIHSFNLWTIILGWEGLGIRSFYLIFYYNNFERWKRAIKTFINNKIGDCIILISIIIIEVNSYITKIVTLLFLLSMITKRAQYPFIAWLPIAMSAPTPISAIVHSSTLVTAGLFIIFRLINKFTNKININIILNLCLISMLFRGIKAVVEKDMKKIIALSTLRQIRLIFFFLLINIKNLAYIYICNHALFKSLMFINIGIIINLNFSRQLNFRINNLNLLGVNILSYKIACLNLINISFFSSFFIKEKIIINIETFCVRKIKFIVFLINSFLTINYRLKIIFFFNNNNFKKKESLIKTAYSDIIFFLINILSIHFRKIVIYFYINNGGINIIIINFYIISIILNFKIYKNNFFLFKSIAYLNFIIYIYPFNFFKKSLETHELWIEKFSLDFYFYIKNKLLHKSFNINFKIIIILFFILIIV